MDKQIQELSCCLSAFFRLREDMRSGKPRSNPGIPPYSGEILGCGKHVRQNADAPYATTKNNEPRFIPCWPRNYQSFFILPLIFQQHSVISQAGKAAHLRFGSPFPKGLCRTAAMACCQVESTKLRASRGPGSGSPARAPPPPIGKGINCTEQQRDGNPSGIPSMRLCQHAATSGKHHGPAH